MAYADVHKHADEYRDPTITNTPTDTATPTHTPTVTNTPTRHADAGHADPANRTDSDYDGLPDVQESSLGTAGLAQIPEPAGLSRGR